MNFEEFTESVRDSIRDHLPEQYRGAEVRISEFQKLNKSYTSLQVVSGEHAPVPNINLDSYFEAYRNGSMGMDDIMKNISKQLEEEPPLDTDWLMDYGQVKDKLCIRLADAKENESFLRNKPHKEVDGLAVTYNVVFNTPDGMSASVPVNNNMMKMYGISEEQLHADALASSQTLFPATCVSLAKMMGDMMGLDADTVMPTMDEPQLMVLTNDQAFHGAGALFYPGQMEALRKAADELSLFAGSTGGGPYTQPVMQPDMLTVKAAEAAALKITFFLNRLFSILHASFLFEMCDR